MGIGLFSHWNSCIGKNTNTGDIVKLNPDPKKFEILEIQEHINTVAVIKYPNCKNFEGIKIMVFKGKVANKLKNVQELDPHFNDDKTKLSPIARFEPNIVGKYLALKLANEKIQFYCDF